MYSLDLSIFLEGLAWQSDWNGDEVGFDEVDVVGLYSMEKDTGEIYNFYIDMNELRVLDFWVAIS